MAFTFPMIGPDKVSKAADLALEIFWKIDNVAVDLTGYTIIFVITKFGAEKFTASTTNGKITVPTPASGKAYLRITEAELDTIPSGTHRYTCVAVKDGITEFLIEESQIEIS